MDQTDRIAQWENMTQADPDNSMGWFSLGNAYRDAQRYEDAAAALNKAIDLDASLSRGYQLLGQVLLQLDRHEEAGEVLQKGYRIAAEQGDVMPEKAMGSLLEKLGIPLPEVERQAPEAPPSGGEDGELLVDRRTGKTGLRLDDPPLRGAIGKFIYDHYTQETWREWIGMGTKVINELRLDLSRSDHGDTYEEHMLEWLGFTKEEAEAYAAHANDDDAPQGTPGH